KRVKILAHTMLIVLTIVTIGSLIGKYYDYDFFKMKEVSYLHKGRLLGIVSAANYGSELPIIVLFLWSIFFNLKDRQLVNKKLFIVCLIINTAAVYFSGLRGGFYGFVL